MAGYGKTKGMFPGKMEVEALRAAYVGKRVKLVEMVDDPCPVAPGSVGTVGSVDDAGTLHMKWDDGRTLGLVPGQDKFEVV